VPFWAVWPFETIVIPRRHAACLPELSAQERDSLADIDAVFETPSPIQSGFHQRPTDGEPRTEWYMHAYFYPRLLRSATVRKFMVAMKCSPHRSGT
jgi:UDPglucose--hexose-1-phosphate uridylyltransferase